MRQVEHVMGTVFSIDLPGVGDGDPMAAAGLERVRAELHRIDARYSTYLDDSEISRLRDGRVSEQELTQECADVLAACRMIRQETRYTFDPWCLPAGVDPSGYVKGWAIGRAVDLLVQAGFTDIGVNGGGDIQVLGGPSPGRAWRLGIRDPHDAELLAAVVELSDGAMATSGGYERGGHIYHPLSREPITDHAILSATVIGPDPGAADAYATALFVAGPDGFQWLPVERGYHGLVITAAGRIESDSGFPLLRQHFGSDTAP